MNNNNKIICSNTGQSDDDYNSIAAVEAVYPAEIIDNAEHVNSLAMQSHETSFNPQQDAANDSQAVAGIYSLNSARMAKHNRSLERRANKSQLTDRRSTARLNADGQLQQDRRADNRIANVESIRQANPGNADRQ